MYSPLLFTRYIWFAGTSFFLEIFLTFISTWPLHSECNSFRRLRRLLIFAFRLFLGLTSSRNSLLTILIREFNSDCVKILVGLIIVLFIKFFFLKFKLVNGHLNTINSLMQSFDIGLNFFFVTANIIPFLCSH